MTSADRQMWIVIFKHEHGVDAFPVFDQDQKPTVDEAVEVINRYSIFWGGEDIEIVGPYRVPAPGEKPEAIDDCGGIPEIPNQFGDGR